MRRVREILRLKYEGGATERAIARSLGVARSAVALTLERAAAAKLSWPLPLTLTDRVLEAMLYAGAGVSQGRRRKAEPDWTHVHRELRRPGVTLMLAQAEDTKTGNKELWNRSLKPKGDAPPRPTSIGMAGRLQSEQVGPGWRVLAGARQSLAPR
jgi:hypothetical protein